MTYYEWVSYIESLSNKPINDEIIKKINTYNFDYSNNIMTRIVDHIINVIFKKLSNKKDDIYNELNNIKSPQELSLLINKIKETINDINKLLSIKYFDESLKNDLKVDIDTFINTYTEIIKKHFSGTINSEYAVILNNMNFMEEK